MMFYKTTLIIWSREDMSKAQPHELMHAVDTGACYLASHRSELVTDPVDDPYPPSTEFIVSVAKKNKR